MRILITGGTGTLGHALIEQNKKHDIVVLSRNETKQLDTKNKFADINLEFISGDVADSFMVEKAIKGCDIVYHLAANKHIEKAEVNPHSTVQTNIIGTQNIINSSIRNNVKKVIGISSDKACNPVNLYGMSKRIGEKLFIEADLNCRHTDFFVVRYGNVLHSAGSVTTKWLELVNKNQKIQITNPNMKRFYFTVQDAVDLIEFVLNNNLHGRIIMRHMKSLTLKQLADMFCKVFDCEQETINIRRGEKEKEQLIADYEVPFAWNARSSDHIRLLYDNFPDEQKWSKRHDEYNTSNCEEFSDLDVETMIRTVCKKWKEIV